MKLCLGTAQFGSSYGISNRLGRPSIDSVKRIIEAAESLGISDIDSAPFYGDCEAVLAKVLGRPDQFQITSKIPSNKNNSLTRDRIGQLVFAVETTLRSLKLSRLSGLLLHDVEDIFRDGGDLLIEALSGLKREGKISGLGVSLYHPENLQRSFKVYNFDLIQFPLNIFDQRFLNDGILRKYKNMGVKLYARSLFLQGLLLMDLEDVPAYFKPIFPLLSEFHKELKEKNVSTIEAAFDFIRNQNLVDYAVVGVNSLEELTQNFRSYTLIESKPEIDYSKYFIPDINMVCPYLWKV